jgi:O-antigen/teichoic acid export membrane protein
MGVKHTIRRTMLALGAGVVVQRACQLAGFLLAGRALGVAGLGFYAQGLAMAAVLGVVAGAGVRNVTARTLTRHPGAARDLVLDAVRRRAVIGLSLAALVVAIAFAASAAPWFWCVCALHAVPGAFDLKNLLDAAGRARREVAIETGVAVLQLAATAVWFASGDASPVALAAIALACRCLYALAAIPAIRELRGGEGRVRAAAGARLAGAQTVHELLTIGDVWLVALAFGDAAAGYYAFAVRFAAAALVPSAQLTRLLLPHQLHAGNDGDAGRTLATALRATAFATLPMLAGGAVVARDLCAWSAPAFADAHHALQLLLAAGCLQHLGWQCSSALLANHRDRACAHAFFWPSAAHAAALAALPIFVSFGAADTALLAAAVTVSAQGTYAVAALAATRAQWHRHRGAAWHAVLLAAAVAAAAALPSWLVEAPLLLPVQLAGGATAFVCGLWWVELRGRWRRVGDGLVRASGFVA